MSIHHKTNNSTILNKTTAAWICHFWDMFLLIPLHSLYIMDQARKNWVQTFLLQYSIFQWQVQQTTLFERKVSVGGSMHRVNRQHILGKRRSLLLFYPKGHLTVVVDVEWCRYLHRQFLLPFTVQGQSQLQNQALKQLQLGSGRLH